MTHESIREKITTILNSEDTTTFLNNVTKPLGNKTRKPIIIRGQDVLNSFLYNIFNRYIENLNNVKATSNLIINDKKIIGRGISNKSIKLFFNSFKYREGEEFYVKKNLKDTKEKLNLVNYFLIIIIYKDDESFKGKYDFYLIPAAFFYFDDRFWRKTGRSYSGDNWNLQCNKDFYFKFNINNLGNPIFSYSF